MDRAAIVNHITVLARQSAPIILALFTFAYVIRGGVLLFGFVNLTAVFLLLALACVGVLLVFDRSTHRGTGSSGRTLRWRPWRWPCWSTAAPAQGLEKAFRFVDPRRGALLHRPPSIDGQPTSSRKFHIHGPCCGVPACVAGLRKPGRARIAGRRSCCRRCSVRKG